VPVIRVPLLTAKPAVNRVNRRHRGRPAISTREMSATSTIP
jgi:hypothetical protein